MLGRFLEISVTTSSVLDSLSFYRQIGCHMLSNADIWEHPYAVVSEGRMVLGLHQYAFDSPAVTFVQPGLRQHAERLQSAGIKTAFAKLGDHEFNELGFTSPDGLMITLLEAGTCAAPDLHGAPPTCCGRFFELQLPVHDLVQSMNFFESLGFVITARDERHGYAALGRDGLNISLSCDTTVRRPALVFQISSLELACNALEQSNIPFHTVETGHSPELQLQSPENTPILVRSTPAPVAG